MRIAFIVSEFPSLSETFILNQITGLIDRGHEVDIYASRPKNLAKVHADVQRYGLLARTYYRPRMLRSRFLRVLKGMGLLLMNGWRAPISLLRTLNFIRYGKPAASCTMLYAAIPHLKQRRYDIVHCHFGPNGVVEASLRDAGVVRGKLITVFHGYDMTMELRRNGEGMYARLFDLGDLFLPISEHWASLLVRMGCNPSRVAVHHMGIDLGRFEYVARTLKPGGIVRLVSIARLTEKKGIEYAIRAVAALTASGKQVEYRVIGDGPVREELESLIDELGVRDSVVLVGSKQQEEVIEILKQSHLFLAPSVTASNGDQEGTPVAIMEAMAMGLPVVSTRHSGIPELVDDGRSGYLVAERDVGELTQRLGELVDHPEAWPRMGEAGRAIVEDRYDINKLNDRLVEIYQRLLAGSE